MADITLCANGKDCPVSQDCYRYKAYVSEPLQSWSNFNKNQGADCENYWPITDAKEASHE